MKIPAVVAPRPTLSSIDRFLLDAAAALLFPTLQVLDVVTTLFDYRVPEIHEANPVTAWYLATYGPFAYLVVKIVWSVFLVGFVALASVAAKRYERPWLRTIGYVVLAIACFGSMVVVGINLVLLHRIDVF